MSFCSFKIQHITAPQAEKCALSRRRRHFFNAFHSVIVCFKISRLARRRRNFLSFLDRTVCQIQISRADPRGLGRPRNLGLADRPQTLSRPRNLGLADRPQTLGRPRNLDLTDRPQTEKSESGRPSADPSADREIWVCRGSAGGLPDPDSLDLPGALEFRHVESGYDNA